MEGKTAAVQFEEKVRPGNEKRIAGRQLAIRIRVSLNGASSIPDRRAEKWFRGGR